MSDQVHVCHYNGTCCQCGAIAEAHDADGSAAFLYEKTGRYSVAKVIAVICGTQDHAYYTLDYTTEVPDPLTAEEEMALLRGE